MRGINIQKPWSELILQGKKKVEARRYPLGNYRNEDLWIIETKGAVPSPIVGTVRFASDFKYESIEQWRADFSQHCVTEESEFTWDGKTEMWGWVISSARRLIEAQEGPSVKGQRGCKAVTRSCLFEVAQGEDVD